MICPFYKKAMVSGFVQARGEVYFTENPHKMLFAARGNDVVLTQHNNTAPTCTAWHCAVCRKVVIAYQE